LENIGEVIQNTILSGENMRNPGVWVINHVVANDIVADSNGYNVIKPIVSFQGINKNNVFKSLDHFIMAKGKYKIRVDIADVETDEVIVNAELDKDFIEAPENGYTHAVNCTWRYLVLQPGIFAYRIFINDIQIATFPIAQFESWRQRPAN
jgi:hypothetical protein